MRKLLRLLCVMGILGILLFPMPVLAIDDPDTPLSVNAVYVYDDLLEEGDVGVLIDYYIDYSVSGNPTETATEAYLATFIDVDGATQLKTVAPYTFDDAGYGRGLIWIYFTEAEVTADNITSGNIALYEVWLMGNPTLGWAGDPPKTEVGVDYWQPAGSDTAVLMALRVLYYADLLELIWAENLIEETSLGNRLTTLGESYFVNVIPNLRTIAPSAFSAGQFDPVMEDLDYATSFGAVLTNAGGTATGSPITLSPEYSAGTAEFTNGSPTVLGTATEWNDTMVGAAIEYTADGVWYTVLDVVDSTNLTLTINYTDAGGTGAYSMTNHIDVLTLGTFTIELNRGTEGTATTYVGGSTVEDSPVTLRYGTNTINTETAIGNIVVAVGLVTTQTRITDTITGTALDLTELAETFGMSRLMFSGLIWMVVTIIICAATYKAGAGVGITGGGKVVFLVFDVCIIAGAILGLLSILIAVLLFIGCGAFIGYILFFRQAHI